MVDVQIHVTAVTPVEDRADSALGTFKTPGVRSRWRGRLRGSRPHLGALLLGYYIDVGKLIYGRVAQ